MICKNCNKNIPDKSTFCPFCGMGIDAANQDNAGKNQNKGKGSRKVSPVPIIVGAAVLAVVAAMVVILLITQKNKGGINPAAAAETTTKTGQQIQEQTTRTVVSNETEPENTVTAAVETMTEPQTDAQIESHEASTEAQTEARTETSVQTTTAEIVTQEAQPNTEKASNAAASVSDYNDMISGSKVVIYINGFHKVYTSADLTVRGTISYGASDISCVESEDVQLLKVEEGSNGRAMLIRYNTSNGQVEGYIEMSIVSNGGSALKNGISSGGFLISLTKTGDFTEDHQVAAGDEVYFISDEGGGIFCVMYTLDSGGYRIAYCRESDYNKYVN